MWCGWRYILKNVIKWKDIPDYKKETLQVSSWENNPLGKEFREENNNKEIVFFSTVNYVEYAEDKMELQSRVDKKGYSVKAYSGQNTITTKWICTKKETKDSIIIKARLVIRGFQDENSESVRSDLPTCSKESQWIILIIIADQK